MADPDSYYSERPVERLERGVHGLKSLVRLMETGEPLQDGLAPLLDVLVDDLDGAAVAIRAKLPTD